MKRGRMDGFELEGRGVRGELVRRIFEIGFLVSNGLGKPRGVQRADRRLELEGKRQTATGTPPLQPFRGGDLPWGFKVFLSALRSPLAGIIRRMRRMETCQEALRCFSAQNFDPGEYRVDPGSAKF